MNISVTVKPSSKQGDAVQPGLDGTYLVYVKEPAIDGKANKAVIQQLAKHFEVSKSQVLIIRGLTSKNKIVQIH